MNAFSLRFYVAFASLLLCSSALNGGEVARVGEAVVTTEVLRQTVARHGYNVYDEASVKQGLEDAVQFELLAAEAKRLGLDRDPAVSHQIKELLVQKLLAEKVDGPLATAPFSDEEQRAYYTTYTNEFRRSALARGNVLTIHIEPGKEADAQAKAQAALNEWRDLVSAPSETGNRLSTIPNGRAEPAALVKKYSDDASERLSGGIVTFVEGQAGHRYPPEVEEAMLSLRMRGEVAGPVAASRALYLVGLTEKREAQLTSFEQAKPEVQKRLARERRQKAITEYCAELRKEFPVGINESQLKAAVEPSKPGGGPPRGPVDAP